MRQFREHERHPRLSGESPASHRGTNRARIVRLTRLYLEDDLTPGSVLELPPHTTSHLIQVLRARSGDELILFNGDGRELTGAIQTVRGSRVSVALGDARTVDRESPFAITLVQCVPRGDRMDFIVQKATELGVARIVPVLSQRSVVRLDKAQAQSKAAHWRAVAVSACEQCGRNRIPAVEPPQSLLNYLGGSAAGGGPKLVFEPDSTASGLLAAPAPGGAVEIAIGPEGGFAADELEAFRVAGYSQVGLGPRVLRTETAAIAAVVWLQARCGDM
jgi:16S rRNA (uracil1498-N3)-methyltransferase